MPNTASDERPARTALRHAEAMRRQLRIWHMEQAMGLEQSSSFLDDDGSEATPGLLRWKLAEFEAHEARRTQRLVSWALSLLGFVVAATAEGFGAAMGAWSGSTTVLPAGLATGGALGLALSLTSIAFLIATRHD